MEEQRKAEALKEGHVNTAQALLDDADSDSDSDSDWDGASGGDSLGEYL